MAAPLLNCEEIELYECGKPETKLSLGVVFPAKRKDGAEVLPKDYLIKRTPKTEKTAANAYKNEYEAFAKIKHTNIASAVSFFEDKENFYVVYEAPLGKRLTEAPKGNDETKRRIIIQFFHMLLHFKVCGVYYLRPEADNAWVNERNKLTLVGLDYAVVQPEDKKAKIEALSKFQKFDQELGFATDWLSLGVFADFILFGKRNPFKGDKLEWAGGATPYKSFFDKVFKDQKARLNFNPFKEPLLQRDCKVVVQPTYVQVDTFRIDWSDGFAVSIGETTFGISLSRLALELSSGETVFSVGANGIQIKDGWKSVGAGPNGIDIKDRAKSLNLGPAGIKLDFGGQGEVTLGAEGLIVAVGSGKVVLGEKLEITGFEMSDVKKELNLPNLNLQVKNLKIGFGPSDGVSVNCEGVGFSVGPKGLVLQAGLTQFCILLDPAGVRMTAGNGCLDINGTGVHLSLGEVKIDINGQGLTLLAEGFTISIGGKGFEMKNENEPIDFQAIIQAIPKKIDLPLSSFLKFDPPPLPPIPCPNLLPDFSACCLVV